MNFQEKSEQIKSWALELGFDDCGIAKAEPLPENTKYLKNWIGKGYNASMKYLGNNLNKRTKIKNLVENAKSVIVVLLSYNPLVYPFKDKHLKISRYALLVDYHSTIKKKLNQLLKKIIENYGKTNGRIFVDSAPLFEKAWAHKAGLGWIGKNSLLLNKEFGSFCFLGELVIDSELEYDSNVEITCGTCTLCVEACPTRAIVSPHVIDANRCIAYNTIENKGIISNEVQKKMSGWIYGCDICQEVCPWNNKSKHNLKTEFISFNSFESINDSDWEHLSLEDFNKLFINSPIKRAGYERLKRNIEANLKLK
jgi:epoxyqueuosine reductase